jgi:hypothetical protein
VSGVLAAIAAASDPSIAAHAVAEPPAGRWEAEPGLDPERGFVMEAVYEGYLLHYGEPRAFSAMDDDLRLLAGDALYALGLQRLADAGDLAAVTELADLISLCAQSHAEARPELCEPLWRATLAALSPAGGTGARAMAEAERPTGANPA